MILTAAASEAIDSMVSGLSGGSAEFVNGAGNFGPASIFGLEKRISKTVPAVAVADAASLGKLYAGPVALARFEENAGKTNTSLVRLKTHAVFGVERQNAAVRIAAS